MPLMHSPAENYAEEDETTATPVYSMTVAAAQQNKTRRRRGSLRKAALLGRGVQRDKREARLLTVNTGQAVGSFASKSEGLQSVTSGAKAHSALGLGISDLGLSGRPASISEQSHNYNSTTDEEDLIQIGSPPAASLRAGLALSSSSESYFGSHTTTAQRHRSFQQAKSPLSFGGGISTTALPPADSNWDYSETEWWGWVVLTVTWLVFVMGMGSCLDVWSWAWDVGTTPYAPPELEDDPTLPIVGYYPALIILTCVMAWVWVVVAWVGMKYFRHAKISGD